MYSGELPWKILRNVIFAFCEEGLLAEETETWACAEARVALEPIIASKPNAANNRFMARAAPEGKMARGVGAAALRPGGATGLRFWPALREFQTVRGTFRSASDKAPPRGHRRHRRAREFPRASAGTAPSAEAAACRHDRNRRPRP